MKFNKSHFWYTKSQRNGILFLALSILVIQGILLSLKFLPVQDHDSSFAFHQQQQIDSLRLAAEPNTKEPKIFPFNPSYLTDEKGYKLGLSFAEIDRVLAHRAQGKFINSAKEFQEISKISDSLLAEISSYFKFPEWLNQQRKIAVKRRPLNDSFRETNRKAEPPSDLNTAKVTDLIKVKGIGNKLAQRIVNYREKLNGFTMEAQLFEVYYLDSIVARRVLDRFTLLSRPKITKLNLNTASFKEVLGIVYIDYELTKKIFNYRDEIAQYESLDQLKNIEGFPLDKFDRIALYLQVK